MRWTPKKLFQEIHRRGTGSVRVPVVTRMPANEKIKQVYAHTHTKYMTKSNFLNPNDGFIFSYWIFSFPYSHIPTLHCFSSRFSLSIPIFFSFARFPPQSMSFWFTMLKLVTTCNRTPGRINSLSKNAYNSTSIALTCMPKLSTIQKRQTRLYNFHE